jgi:hypothetical protein
MFVNAVRVCPWGCHVILPRFHSFPSQAQIGLEADFTQGLCLFVYLFVYLQQQKFSAELVKVG